jgi:hypothetical protein
MDGMNPPDLGKLRAELLDTILSSKAIRALFAALTRANANVPVLSSAIRPLLAMLGPAHVDVVLNVLPDLPEGEIKDQVVDYVARNGAGHEKAMGELFAHADLEVGLALIRVLARIETRDARDAISRAAQSPHAVVRIEALGHLEGGSGERIRVELRSLLEDRDPDVRLAALKAVQDHVIRPAGPYLVLRIKTSGFDKLPLEERRLVLGALAALAQSRAEAVCVELIKEARMMTTEAHEETRTLAAELLGQISASREALTVLTTATGSRWRNSERVRTAASRACELIQNRISQASRAGNPGGGAR